MTYQEAQSMYNRIINIVIGSPVKGRLIESLFIGPTDWKEMTSFLNLRIQKGEETALLEFSHYGKSLSVYGVSVTMINENLPRWNVTILDDWEKAINN